MENKILIIFESNKAITKETIYEAAGLKHKYCDITTLEDVLANKQMLKEYEGVLDCTFKSILFANQLASKKGIKLTEQGIEYIKTTTNKFICVGPTITQLTALNFNQSENVVNKYKKDFESYKNMINFLTFKIPELRNKINFNNAISQNIGINLNDMITNNKIGTTYKLVKSIPEKKEANTEYITFDNIYILNELKKIIETIK